MITKNLITSEEELREIVGHPSELVQQKAIFRLDQHCKDFIAQSPMIFIATADQNGSCDVSPRGDAPGFVETVGDGLLIIPERPGNKRCDSLTNILSNPRIGIIFVIPGLEETLRINGKAVLSNDEELLERHRVNGKTPKLVIVVEVVECFVHCAKAFIRSKLWHPDAWPPENRLPSIPKMVADHVGKEGHTADTVANALKESYRDRLY